MLAWVAVAVMIALLAAMPLIGSALEMGDENPFWVGALSLVGFLVVLLVFATGAIRFGLEARAEGREAGIVPAAIGGAIGGLFALLVLAVIVGHLAGFE